jgi:hypothetical protein
MSKRAHESAFALGASGGMPVAVRSGFDAPSPQVGSQLEPPLTRTQTHTPAGAVEFILFTTRAVCPWTMAARA